MVLKFIVFKDGEPQRTIDLQGAYLVGPDDVPIRGQIECGDGVISCRKSIDDAAALSLMWEVKHSGKYLLQTTRLADRDRPYILNVELARWRLMRMMQKVEDWALFGYPEMVHITRQIDSARALFIQALQGMEDASSAAKLGDRSLEISLEAGEALAKFHAMKMLVPRLQAGGIGRKIFGCRLDPSLPTDSLAADIFSTVNFVQLPLCWAELQPARDQFAFGKLDGWFDFLLKRRVTIKVSSVIRLQERHVPPFLRAKNIEFEAFRDLVYEYLSHIANRYGKYIRSWTILSGIHAENCFGFNFDQILELTRLASMRAKQLCPRAAAVIEILGPWGEYYAHNLRTIHPFLYADMVSQSGINFDGFGLKLLFGAAKEGVRTRDVLQISSLIDRYAVLGKPLHITTAAPSQVAGNGDTGGYWGNPWSPATQARWLEMMYQVALSKPQVESITWDSLADESSAETIPFSGLYTRQASGKPALGALRELQKRLAEAQATLRAERG